MSEQSCPKCKAVYEVREIKISMRDKDTFECDCGESLASWDGSHMLQFSLILPGKPAPPKA